MPEVVQYIFPKFERLHMLNMCHAHLKPILAVLSSEVNSWSKESKVKSHIAVVILIIFLLLCPILSL